MILYTVFDHVATDYIIANGWSSSIYLVLFALIAIALASIIGRVGLFEAVSGFGLILFGVLVINNPVVNTFFNDYTEKNASIVNHYLFITQENFLFHPYLEVLLIIFGIVCIVMAYDDYTNTV